MKILFLIVRYFPYSGLQTDFLRAAEAAADRGHDVTCLVGSWEGERPDKLRILTTNLPGTGEADDLDALETAPAFPFVHADDAVAVRVHRGKHRHGRGRAA